MGYKLGQRSFLCQLGVKCQNDDGQKFLESFHRSDPVPGCTAEVTGQGVFLNQKPKPKKEKLQRHRLLVANGRSTQQLLRGRKRLN